MTDKLTGYKSQSTLANVRKKNQDISSNIDDKNISKDIKNLLFIIKSTKSKKPNFAKINSVKIDFLISRAKKAFIYL